MPVLTQPSTRSQHSDSSQPPPRSPSVALDVSIDPPAHQGIDTRTAASADLTSLTHRSVRVCACVCDFIDFNHLIDLLLAAYMQHAAAQASPQCVSSPNKHRRAQVAKRAAHDAKAHAEHGGVAKVERGLKETRHLCLGNKVVYAVEVHIPAQQSASNQQSAAINCMTAARTLEPCSSKLVKTSGSTTSKQRWRVEEHRASGLQPAEPAAQPASSQPRSGQEWGCQTAMQAMLGRARGGLGFGSRQGASRASTLSACTAAAKLVCCQQKSCICRADLLHAKPESCDCKAQPHAQRAGAPQGGRSDSEAGLQVNECNVGCMNAAVLQPESRRTARWTQQPQSWSTASGSSLRCTGL